MKPYGVPSYKDVEYPDKADIKRYGMATTDRCSRQDRGKNTARRFWAKKARNEENKQIEEELN